MAEKKSIWEVWKVLWNITENCEIEKKGRKQDENKGKSGVMDMTQGNMAMLILSFALPLMLGNVFQQFYTVADTAIVGKILGVDALAALGTVESINWLVLGTIQGITRALASLFPSSLGVKKRRRFRKPFFMRLFWQ